tara:strand:- start:25880 stop:26320 length:441 start_codon:yes stop_codon:yes gene_type:complete
VKKNQMIRMGKQLKFLRKKTGLTQPELARASGVTTSIVNDLENGIRTAGSKTLDKIARGLELHDKERFLLLLNGLSLSKRDFLIPDFSSYSPELLNFLPYVLFRSGIKPENISNIELPDSNRKNLEITLKSKQTLSLEIRLAQTSK